MSAFAERYRCKALAKSTGERCKRAAHPGAEVCVKHGAGAPQVRASAKRRLEERRVQAKVGRILADLELEIGAQHPVMVLASQVNRAAAMVELLGTLVGELDDSEGAWHKRAALFGPDHLGDGAQHVLVSMYERWVVHAGKLSKLAIEAGLDERRTKLEEGQAALVGQVLRGVLAEVGVDILTDRARAALTRWMPVLDGKPQPAIIEATAR